MPPSDDEESKEPDTANITAPVVSNTAKMESALWQTLSDMQARTEVEACMNSVLVDVETTFYLSQELQLQSHQHRVNELTRQQKATVLEADAERSAREEERLELADQMVQELMTLSRELETLMQWKKEHEPKVNQYDEVVAKLAQTEEELQAAQRIHYEGDPKPRAPDDSARSEGQDAGEANKTSPESPTAKSVPTTDQEQAGATLSTDDAKLPTPTEDAKPPAAALDGETAAETPIDPSKPVVEENATTEAPTTEATKETPEEQELSKALAEIESTADETPEPAAAAVVTLDEEDPAEEVPGLAELEMEVLMSIFGYLDAMDILNTAQVNLTMYSKVDNIFGISEDGQSPPQPTPAQAPAPQPASKPVPTATGSTVSPPAGPKPPPPGSTPGLKPAPPTPSKGTTTAPSATAASGPGSGPLGKGLFSMLQPRATGKKSASPMNPSVAQSMASKLSDAELAAILSMTDKLNKADKEVNLLRNEKESLVAKLEGTEAVKQFLINKVRDVEVKLNQSRDEEVKVTQQISSDQEVIAFLDGRVQELERQTEDLTTEKTRVVSELESVKVTTSKKITMLSDMLKYEREKQKDEEGEWKATKKVLVKEVKSCRAQILALHAERDGLKEQNEMLKRAIISTGKSAIASPSR